MKERREEYIFKLAKEIERIQKINDNFGVALDSVQYKLKEGYFADGKWRRPKRHPMEHAHRLCVSWKPNGSATVSIDNIPPFTLPLVSAHLLEVLAMDGEDADPADRPYVPFKSYRSIMAEMSRRLGRPYNEHALKQAVYRLKLQLYPYRCEALVFNNRYKKAYRFVLVSRYGALGAAAL
jgi:hypothetical protein